ncbi:MAG TPA: ATP-grasp domain-containing protein [Gaiellales bacterium]
MQATSVLLTCAGQRVDMVEAFRRALAEEGRGGVAVACDLNPLSPALYSADVRALAPPVSAPSYIPTLLELVREHAIRAVLPLTDLDQRILIDQRVAFAEAGATVIASPPEVCDRCADKHDAARFFVAHGIPSPRTWLPEDLPPHDELRFPVLVKSRRGFGSRDIYRCRDVAELEFFLGYTPVPSMVQEVCGGEEFSIDVLCDLDGRCVSSIPRSMIESKGGESIKGRTLDDAELVAFGALVAETLPIHGPATIQCFRTAPGRHEVTDVNPRFGGAFPLPLAAGGAYPSLVLALARGEQLESRLGAFRPGVVMTRYLSHVALVEQDGAYEPLSAAELPAVS